MSESDSIYYYKRAEAELQQAKQATHPGAVAAHRHLAEAYLKKLAPTGSASRTQLTS